MLKQIEIKVSLCKKSDMHQPIRLRKDGFTAKNIEFSESNLLSVLKAEFKLSNIVDKLNMIFNYSTITQEQRDCG